MLIHIACNGEMTEESLFCSICDRDVDKVEIAEVDDSPGPFSG